MIIRKAYVVNFDRVTDWFDSSPFAKIGKQLRFASHVYRQPHTTSCHVICFCYATKKRCWSKAQPVYALSATVETLLVCARDAAQ